MRSRAELIELGISENIVNNHYATLGTVNAEMLSSLDYAQLVTLKRKYHNAFDLFPGFLDVAAEICTRDKAS